MTTKLDMQLDIVLRRSALPHKGWYPQDECILNKGSDDKVVTYMYVYRNIAVMLPQKIKLLQNVAEVELFE